MFRINVFDSNDVDVLFHTLRGVPVFRTVNRFGSEFHAH